MKELNKVGVEEMLVVRTFEKNLRFEQKKTSKITPTLRKICLLVPFGDNNSINLRNLRVEKISALLAPRPVET